ncbi:MAG: hypothetical protein RLZ86_1491 [Actinomycetota bacterium]|jgi:hypothetical protein
MAAAAGPGLSDSTSFRSVGRGVTAFSITAGVLVVVGLALIARPVSGRSDTADAIRLSGADIELVSLDDSRTDAPIAVMVEQGPLLVTTLAAVGDRSQLRVRLTDGSTHDVEVVHVDEATSIAILALPLDEPAPDVSLPNVPITRDQEVVVISERAHRMSVMSLADDRRAVIGTRSTTFDPFSVAEGAPVIDRSGRLVGLCTHEGNDVVLIDTNTIQSVLSSLFAGFGASD